MTNDSKAPDTSWFDHEGPWRYDKIVPDQEQAELLDFSASAGRIPTLQELSANDLLIDETEDDDPKDDTSPFSDYSFNVYVDTLSALESSGKSDVVGGANGHYDGLFQMGRLAKIDAGKRLGITLAHDAASREAFTEANHDTLMRLSSKYRRQGRKEKMETLAVSHLLGAGGGLDYLNGQDGEDAFSTRGSKYAVAVRTALAGGDL
jgi:hypothetical protein|tara:strand:+ start:2450 stop:3067 length:618 start_codon:yes stop_codon:yes gene_type:complete